jgi:2-isopropylmalate synthase
MSVFLLRLRVLPEYTTRNSGARAAASIGRFSPAGQTTIATNGSRGMTQPFDPNDESQLIYDWNLVDSPPQYPTCVEFDDETLRDGIQSPSVRTPNIDEKKRFLHLIADLGIQSADIGLPGAGPAVKEDVVALAREIADNRLPIEPNCAARTLAVDIEPIVEATQRSGIGIEASVFIGSSPIRQYVEGWNVDDLVRLSVDAIRFAIDHGLSVMYVTEDTTRAKPETIRTLYTAAIDAGARRICVADTVGHITPHGTRQLIRFIRDIADKSGHEVKIDWHGHRDRALSLENSLAAVEAGVDRVHGTALGVGERCGNTPMEHLLINFRLLGAIQNDLSKLSEYCRLASEICDVPVPFNHPVTGPDAYRTSTGVHAAAVIKAMRAGQSFLANRIYSGVPANWTGCTQSIEIGPMSGASNVVYWLESRAVVGDDALVKAIFDVAKQSDHVLTEAEVWDVIHARSKK